MKRNWLALFVVIAVPVLWPFAIVHASDCPPGGYADCASAASTAQSPLVPIAGAVLGVVLNNVVKGQTRLRPPGGDGDGDKDQEDVQYKLDIRTQEERMVILADGEDRLWLYAKLTCSKPSANSQALTAALSFSFQGEYANWMSLENVQVSGGYRAGQLVAKPPFPDAELKDDAKATILVSGSGDDGEPIQYPVTIALEGELQLKVIVLA